MGVLDNIKIWWTYVITRMILVLMQHEMFFQPAMVNQAFKELMNFVFKNFTAITLNQL